MAESLADRKRRARRILDGLAGMYPDARIELDSSTPLELLVATILSAQCTDQRVNLVTAGLFPKYRTARDWAAIPPARLEREIHSTGFYRAKAKSLLGMARRAGGTPWRRGAAHARRADQAPRRGAQDRQCGAGQCLRDSGPRGGHPRDAGVPAAGSDPGHGRGEDTRRARRHPADGSAHPGQPSPHLAWSADLWGARPQVPGMRSPLALPLARARRTRRRRRRRPRAAPTGEKGTKGLTDL